MTPSKVCHCRQGNRSGTGGRPRSSLPRAARRRLIYNGHLQYINNGIAGCRWFRLQLLDHLLGHGDERACERKTRIGVEISGDPLLAHQLSRPRFLGGALCERLGGFVRRVFIFNSLVPPPSRMGAARQL